MNRFIRRFDEPESVIDMAELHGKVDSGKKAQVFPLSGGRKSESIATGQVSECLEKVEISSNLLKSKKSKMGRLLSLTRPSAVRPPGTGIACICLRCGNRSAPAVRQPLGTCGAAAARLSLARELCSISFAPSRDSCFPTLYFAKDGARSVCDEDGL